MARDFVRASSQYLATAAAAVSAEPLTIAGWIRSTSTSVHQAVCCIGASGSTNWHSLHLIASSGLKAAAFSNNGGTSGTASSSSNISADTWAHVAAVFASSTSRSAYLNGGSKQTNTTSVSVGALNTTAIGRRVFLNDDYFSGRIAELGIWNVALNDNEIAALARGASPLRVRRASLVAYFPLYGFETDERNIVSGSLKMTVTGASQAKHAPVAPSLSKTLMDGQYTLEPRPLGIHPGNRLGLDQALIDIPNRIREIKKRDEFWPFGSSALRGRFYATARGTYRVANAAEFRFYRKLNTPPVVGTDSPFATNATLPHTPASTYANGIWYVGVTYFNGFLESDFIALTRIEIVSGAQVGNPPAAPSQTKLLQRAAGVVRIQALYWPVPDGDNRAEEWAIWRTFDGSTPSPAGAPDHTQTMAFGAGFDPLQYDLAAQAHGTTVKVLVRTRRNDGTVPSPNWVYSTNVAILTTTADAQGPSAPVKLETWRGALPENL